MTKCIGCDVDLAAKPAQATSGHVLGKWLEASRAGDRTTATPTMEPPVDRFWAEVAEGRQSRLRREPEPAIGPETGQLRRVKAAH